jgi:dephospho-CoA kinase
MRQNNIFVIGLTGSIGSGKSTISKLIKEKGLPIIDADIISKEILIKHPNLLEDIKNTFGIDYFDEKGNLLRKKLGSLIFSNKVMKDNLEQILLPSIIKDIFDKVNEYACKGYKYCVVDAPTLIENELHFYMNAIILVTIDKELQIRRVMTRDSLNFDEVLNRKNSQMPQEEKINYADYIINNSGTVEQSKAQLNEILKSLVNIRGKNDN